MTIIYEEILHEEGAGPTVVAIFTKPALVKSDDSLFQIAERRLSPDLKEIRIRPVVVLRMEEAKRLYGFLSVTVGGGEEVKFCPFMSGRATRIFQTTESGVAIPVDRSPVLTPCIGSDCAAWTTHDLSDGTGGCGMATAPDRDGIRGGDIFPNPVPQGEKD